MGAFSLSLSPVAGMDIKETCASAARIAEDLKLHHVTFTHNGSDQWLVYPNYRGFAQRDGRTVAEYAGGFGGGVKYLDGVEKQ
jgi:hypothetical protein